jgi:hypothetical protein
MERSEPEAGPGEVFTPLDVTRRRRLQFRLAEVTVLSGDLDERGTGKKTRVRIRGRVYDVIGCPCDLPGCNCDVYLRPVLD